MAFRVFIRTVGCRTNQADSLALERALVVRGIDMVAEPENADLVIVNSCAVTSRAERDVRQALGQARRAAPGAALLLTGCMVDAADHGLAEAAEVDHVVRTADKMRAVRIVVELADLAAGKCAGSSERVPPACEPPTLRSARPALKVQQGCSTGCAYCIVPLTRGPERSVPCGVVIESILDLARSGAREVVLTGTQLGSWGRDLEPPLDLAVLVGAILEARPVHRVRLSSVEPWGVSPALARFFSSARDGLCRHLHVPLQSGSDAMIGAMGRPGGTGAFLDAVRYSCAGPRPVAVGTDVLVGFPGETDSDFDATRELLASLPLAYLHVFSFSPRPGTRAASMPDRPAPGAVKRRVAELRSLSRALRRAFLERLEGELLEVVLEEPADPGPGALGTSSEFARVAVEDADPSLIGSVVTARVHRIDGEYLLARIAERV